MIERNYYNNFSASAPAREGFVQFVVRNWRPHGVLLDVGTGLGAILSSLGKRDVGILSIGIDHNLRLLYMRPAGTLGVQADATARLPLKNTAVDAVILSSILHLVTDPLALCAEVVRVLKPQGHLFCLTCSEADISRRYLNQFAPGLAALDRERYPSIAALKLKLADLGAPVKNIENVRLGQIRLDAEFLSSLRARPWSTLGLLAAGERQRLFSGLEDRIRSIESGHCPQPRLPVMRTGLVAIKS